MKLLKLKTKLKILKQNIIKKKTMILEEMKEGLRRGFCVVLIVGRFKTFNNL